jgi:type IV pilus assembly protein PilM
LADLKVVENLVEDLKDRLGLGPKTIIGVDIGLSGVKIAELSKKDKSYTLVNYAFEAFPEAVMIEDEIQKPDEIKESVSKALKKLKLAKSNACLGLYGPNTVARKLQVAGGSKEDIEDQVTWEAEQYLPFALEESSLSFHLLGKNEGGGVDIVVAAAKNDIINNFRDLVEPPLKVKIVDLTCLAVVNVFELVMGDKLKNPLESWIIIDMGAQFTQFMIYKNKTIVFTKEMNIGGVMITEEIQRQMGVNYYEAEDLKINGDQKGNLPEEILEIIDDVVESFFAELKKTIDFYISSTSDESMVGCYITGGSTAIPGLIEGLEALLGMSVSVLNPFEAIDYDKKKIKEDINDIAYRGTAAIGLAMRTMKS